MEHLSSNLIAIVLALISAGGMILAARQSHQNAQDIKPIKEVLANSPGAASLDVVIRTIRDEFVAASQRHEKEIRFQNIRIEELETALKHCQHERSGLGVELEKLRQDLLNVHQEIKNQQ